MDRMHSSPPQLLYSRPSKTSSPRIVGKVIESLLLLCALVAVFVTLGIIAIFITETTSFFLEVSPAQFFLDTRWSPLIKPYHYGIWPLISGTLLITICAACFALPIGIASGIFLSENIRPKGRRILKPALEVLAGIPTVVYGYFALTFVTPALRIFIPDLPIFNALSASIVVGIMILPMVMSLTDDALRAVPQSLRDGGYALGAKRNSISFGIVIPSAIPGIVAGFVLAISRAVGETMAVTIAAGSTPNLTINPLESIQTMTAYIVQVSLGDTPAGSIEYYGIFAVGSTLFLITLLINMLASLIIRRSSKHRVGL